MKISQSTKLDFSDVLIHPKFTHLISRSDVVLERSFTFRSGHSWSGIPIIAANMDTVGTFEMCRQLTKHRMITCISKHYRVEDYPEDLDPNYYMVSSGIGESDWRKLCIVVDKIKPNFVCIDVANGYMSKLVEFVQKVREKWPYMVIACGNVVSRDMVDMLVKAGADIVKVGIGSGSVCTTRTQTGVGMPQFSAVVDCAEYAHEVGAMIISDGGITCPGDAAKAFGGGADFVMIGSMFAGHLESGGEVVEENGVKCKIFYGMSSDTAMKKYHGGVANYRSSEGKTVKIRYKGKVIRTVTNLLGGIRSTCTYVDARRLEELPRKCDFIRVNNQVNTIHNGKEVSK